MCGIAGMFNLDGAPVIPESLQGMIRMLAHRGPDDNGFHTENGVGLFFFFKQKTAYDIMPSLVGSEMCIRDRAKETAVRGLFYYDESYDRFNYCLLYTSDAADDLLCVDLGGRRIIKKKKK